MMDGDELENRFTFHPAAAGSSRANAHAQVRLDCLRVADQIDVLVPDGREKALAITKLEEVMMWANAGIARAAE